MLELECPPKESSEACGQKSGKYIMQMTSG
jgi:hypothetical protein